MFIETSAKTGYNVKQVSSDSVFRVVELFMQAVMSFDWLWMTIELQVMKAVICHSEHGRMTTETVHIYTTGSSYGLDD